MLLTARERQVDQLREQLRHKIRDAVINEVRDEVRHEVRDEVRHEQAIQIAKSMLAQNFSPTQIADLIDLSLEQVIQLRDSTDPTTL